MTNTAITSTDIFYGCTIAGRVGRTVKVFAICEGPDEGAIVFEKPEGVSYAVGFNNVCDIWEYPCGCEWKRGTEPTIITG